MIRGPRPCGACGAYVDAARGCEHWKPPMQIVPQPRPAPAPAPVAAPPPVIEFGPDPVVRNGPGGRPDPDDVASWIRAGIRESVSDSQRELLAAMFGTRPVGGRRSTT